MLVLGLFAVFIGLVVFVCLISRLSDGVCGGDRINLRYEGWYLQLPSQCSKDESAHINLWGPAGNGYGSICYGAINIGGADSTFGPNRAGIPGVSREVFMEAMAMAGRYEIPLRREYYKRSDRH